MDSHSEQPHIVTLEAKVDAEKIVDSVEQLFNKYVAAWLQMSHDERCKAVFASYQAVRGAIDRSPYDISPCCVCGQAVVCLPDGIPPVCEDCRRKNLAESQS